MLFASTNLVSFRFDQNIWLFIFSPFCPAHSSSFWHDSSSPGQIRCLAVEAKSKESLTFGWIYATCFPIEKSTGNHRWKVCFRAQSSIYKVRFWTLLFLPQKRFSLFKTDFDWTYTNFPSPYCVLLWQLLASTVQICVLPKSRQSLVCWLLILCCIIAASIH